SLSFFFNTSSTTEIYTLSLHDALPIWPTAPNRYRAWKERWSSIDGGATLRSRFVVERSQRSVRTRDMKNRREPPEFRDLRRRVRSEEHTSELQSRRDLVCRLLLEKKKK